MSQIKQFFAQRSFVIARDLNVGSSIKNDFLSPVVCIEDQSTIKNN